MKEMWRRIFGTMALAFMLCLTGLVLSGMAFAERCVDNGDGTVTDNGTGLMWQKETAGPEKWQHAGRYVDSLSLGSYSDWRMPYRKELLGLYNSPCLHMMDVVPDDYWSQTPTLFGLPGPGPRIGSSYLIFAVDFSDGLLSENTVDNRFYVRAVRDAK